MKRLAAALAEMDCDIITGGGPGLMQAANEGASVAKAPERNRSVGIRIELPFEQDVNPFVTTAFEHKTFFTRLHHFVLTSDAFVVVPGGIGTVLELMMVWQLLQVHHIETAPLILIGKMWGGLVDWAHKHLANQVRRWPAWKTFQYPSAWTPLDGSLSNTTSVGLPSSNSTSSLFPCPFRSPDAQRQDAIHRLGPLEAITLVAQIGPIERLQDESQSDDSRASFAPEDF